MAGKAKSEAGPNGADYSVLKPTFPVVYTPGHGSRARPDSLLVPLGCGVTAAVLLRGLYAFNTGNGALSQRMMRYRILAQGLTVLAMAATMPMIGADSKKPAAAEHPAKQS